MAPYTPQPPETPRPALESTGDRMRTRLMSSFLRGLNCGRLHVAGAGGRRYSPYSRSYLRNIQTGSGWRNRSGARPDALVMSQLVHLQSIIITKGVRYSPRVRLLQHFRVQASGISSIATPLEANSVPNLYPTASVTSICGFRAPSSQLYPYFAEERWALNERSSSR